MAGENFNRRAGDKVIEQVNIRVSDMHAMIARIESKLDAQRDAYDARVTVCGKAFDSKVSGKWFRWAIGLVVVGVVATAGLSADNRVTLSEVKSDLQHHELKVDSAYKEGIDSDLDD